MARESGDDRGAGRSLVWGLLALTIVAAWLVWPAFLPGRIVNLDAPRHLLRTEIMAQQFLPSGHVDGWSPWWYLGAQLFLFQSYGYFFLAGATALVLAPFVSLGVVFKAWYVLPIVVLPAATALMAKKLGVAPRGVLAAGLASIVFSSPLGYGVQGVFGMGLLLQGAGVIGFAFAWPELLGALLDRSRSPWRAALVTAAVLVVHFITGAYTLAVSGITAAWLTVRTREPWRLLRYLLIATVVILLAGHALFPSLELRSLSGAAVGWGNDRDRFDRFVLGTIFGAPPLALAAIVAAAWSIVRAPQPLAISAVVFFGTALVGASNAQDWEPESLNRLVEILFRPRATPYAALLQAVFAGVAVDGAIRGLELASIRWHRPALHTAAVPVVAVLLAAVAIPELIVQHRFVRTESMVRSLDRQVYEKLVAWLRKNVTPPAIVAVPRTLFPPEALGARSVISLLNLDTGLYTLGGDQAELSKSVRRASRVDLDELGEDQIRNASVLRNAGVSYVIVSNPEVRRSLETSAEFVREFEYVRPRHKGEPKRREGKLVEPLGVAVYRVEGGGKWLRGPGVNVLDMRHQPEHIRWTVDVGGTTERLATAAVNWHPNWQAVVDGEPVATRPSSSRHVTFTIPPGARNVELEFVRRPREKVYDAISVAALVFVLVARRREKRRRIATSSN